jgi:signal transduction histidine kinase
VSRRAAGIALLGAAAALLAWEALDRPSAEPGPAAAEDPAALARRLEKGIGGVRERFHALEREALEHADALVPAVLAADPSLSDAAGARAALFDALSAELGEEHRPLSGAAVVDRDGHPLAWWGRVFAGPFQGPPGEEPSTRVFRSRVYRVVRAEVPLTGPGGDRAGAVRVFAPFYASLPLHNRYLRRFDFEAEAEEALGLEKVDLEFEHAVDGPAEPPDPQGRTARGKSDNPPGAPLSARATLEGIRGDPHGTLVVTVRPLEEARAAACRERSRWRRSLVGLLLVAGLFADAPGTRRLPAGWPRGLARAALVLGVREALLLLDVPGSILGGEVFSPSAFSVTWFGGALRNPGDALLTAAAVLAATLTLCREVPRAGSGAGPAARLAAALGAAAAGVLGFVAFTGLSRAAAFQSRIDLIPEDRVLPPAAAAALLLAVGLVVAAGLAAACRLLSLAADRRLYPASPLGRGIAAAAAAAVLAGGWIQWENLQALRQDALTALERLEPSREREERVALANLLGRLAGPEARAAKVIRGRGPRREDAAFYVWAESPELNARPDGCALDILDETGRPISRFDIDMPPGSWLPEYPEVPASGASVEKRRGRKGAAERSFLVGTAPVLDDEGRRRGAVRLAIPADAPAGRPSSRPEILSNYGGSSPPPRERELHLATWDGDRMRDCTHPDFPRGRRAPPEAVERILRGGEPVLWLREKVAGSWYHEAYLPRLEDGRVAGMVSVGFPSITARPFWLNLSKVFFLDLLAAGALGVVSGAWALARGRARLPALGFRAKVLAGFVLVGAVPVVGLALLERSLAEERTGEVMEREVRENLRRVEASLRDAGVLDALAGLAAPRAAPPAPEEVQAAVPDDRVKEIAYRVGVPVNLFLGDSLVASSERGIIATELFSLRLPGPAYEQVVLLGRGAYLARERFGSYPFLVGYAPVRGAGGAPAGVLSVPLLFRQDQADRDLARTTTVALGLYILVLLGVAGAGLVLARRMAGPVEALSEATRRVAGGDLKTRIPRGPRDELGALVDSFNRMTEGLEAGREAQARAERETAWREMAKQVAHEIKNPLTPMRLHAQHMLRAKQDGSPDLGPIAEKAAEVILRQADALQRIATDFSAFARLPRRNPEPVDLAAMAREAADLHRGAEGLEIVVEAPEGLPPVLADREEMRLVLVNLCGNAAEAMPSGGRLVIRLRADPGPPPAAVLEVEDTGVGIPPGDMPRLFDPSFSTKTRGTGLGLAIVHRAVSDTGGRIAVRSEVGKGSVFTVTIPIAN